jgi:uncharacterized membrane protein affecting hemolysin expression
MSINSVTGLRFRSERCIAIILAVVVLVVVVALGVSEFNKVADQY